VPRPVEGSGQRYLPGLDGLRAIAVLAVIAYHLGVGWAPGGLLGVGVFFTLSGYLITDLLTAQYDRTGRLDLARFWASRARRLLPGLVLVLVVVAAWVTTIHRSQLPSLRGQVLASLGFVSNWWLIGQNVSYFARFAPPGPLGHLWSLAVEEQFYLVWPWLLLLGILAFGAGRRRSTIRVRLAGLTLVLALASAIAMAVLYQPGFDTTRVYDGTDTRAFGLLIGAALALVWPSRALRATIRRQAAVVIDAAGGLALLVVVILILRTNPYSAFLYRGGLVLLSVVTAVVVAVVAHPGSRLGRALGWWPMRWIGVRSYGIYLWHLPVIVLTSPAGAVHRVSAARAELQLLATFALAALSWRFVEDPIRHGALGRLWRGRHRLTASLTVGWRWLLPLAAVGVVITACVGVAVSPSSATAATAGASRSFHETVSLAPPSAAPTATSSRTPTATPSKSTSAARVTSPTHPTVRPGTTSCASVTHIGDSTSEGLVSPDYLPDPAKRIDAQYARVGVSTQNIEISGGTSILETATGEPNAAQVAQGLIASGYRGCWVLALGTNDTADVVVGTSLDRAGRIAKMMHLIGNHPVLWVNVRSLLAQGPYAESAMQAWDTALLQACHQFPTMRIYDWASTVQPAWFVSDGIHFTPAGYAQRARLIANALQHAFPTGGSPAAGCIVH
jgi:peptidoglycan/LPS O-acetylase OafA/YrhL